MPVLRRVFLQTERTFLIPKKRILSANLRRRRLQRKWISLQRVRILLKKMSISLQKKQLMQWIPLRTGSC